MVRRNGNKPREKKAHKPSKYHNKKVVIDDILFASKAEGQHYVNLKQMKLEGKIVDFQFQVPFELLEGYKEFETGKKIRAIMYVADFVVQYPDGHEEVQDVKGSRGYMTDLFKIKKKLFETRYQRPLKIIMVKIG